MSPHHDHNDDQQRAAVQRITGSQDDRLLTPREVAELFGVRTTTIARWVREGRLTSFLTPGGHRRYHLPEVRALLNTTKPAPSEAERQMTQDAVRLYERGWSIRQVAEKFDVDYTTMRRFLKRNGVHLRRQGTNGPYL